MTTYIVHWKEIVGRDFVDTFLKIAKAEYYANIAYPHDSAQAVKETFKHFSSEDKTTYVKKREYMRKCGYQVDDKVIHWHGWYGPAYLQGNDIQFSTTAQPDKKYISMSLFLSFMRGTSLEILEEEYYQAKKNFTESKDKLNTSNPTGPQPIGRTMHRIMYSRRLSGRDDMQVSVYCNDQECPQKEQCKRYLEGEKNSSLTYFSGDIRTKIGCTQFVRRKVGRRI